AEEAGDQARSRSLQEAKGHRRACLRMGETRARLPSLQPARSAQGRGRVEPRLLGTEPSQDGGERSAVVSEKSIGSSSGAPARPIARRRARPSYGPSRGGSIAT